MIYPKSYHYHLCILEHGSGEFPCYRVTAGGGTELDVEVVNVAFYIEVGGILHGVALHADVETAQTGDVYFLTRQQVVAHHVAEFGEHEDDIRGLRRAVACYLLRELVEPHAPRLARACVVTVFRPLFLKCANYSHDFFLFEKVIFNVTTSHPL